MGVPRARGAAEDAAARLTAPRPSSAPPPLTFSPLPPSLRQSQPDPTSGPYEPADAGADADAHLSGGDATFPAEEAPPPFDAAPAAPAPPPPPGRPRPLPTRRGGADPVFKKCPGAPKRFKSSYVHFFTHFVETQKHRLGPDGLVRALRCALRRAGRALCAVRPFRSGERSLWCH